MNLQINWQIFAQIQLFQLQLSLLRTQPWSLIQTHKKMQKMVSNL